MSLAWLLGPQLEAFASAGYEVIGVSAPGPFVEDLEARGIRHVALTDATRSMDVRADLAAARQLYRTLGELAPDILHTHNPKPGWYGRPVGRAAHVPIVVNTVHGLYAHRDDPLPKRAVVYALERVAAACSHAELVQNPEDIETLAHLGVPRQKMRLLGNGVDLGRFDPARFGAEARAEARRALGAADGELVVGSVGRLVEEKGIVELLGAARRLRDLPALAGDGRSTRLHFALIGPAEPAKADAVSAALLEDAAGQGVSLLGERDDVDALYAGMDVFVLASHREGFPRAAMEAAAMGVPVVATDIRGCRQVVDDGVTGRLVPARDEAALAGAVAELASDPTEREAMSRASLDKARREFDEQRCIDITLGLYAELIDRARADPRGRPNG